MQLGCPQTSFTASTFRRRYWLCASLGLIFFGVTFAYAIADTQKMKEIMAQRYGDDGIVVLKQWQQLVVDDGPRDVDEKIRKVNEFFNKTLRYSEDQLLWKKSDYWATPLEALGARAGDCEDYTIAKYLTLLRMGIPATQLRLIYVRAQVGGMQSKIFQAHMVLGYYPEPNAIPLILDNLMNSIEPANKRPDLRPVFSFNSEGLWVGNQQKNDSTARLSRWRDLLARAREEGF